MNQEDRKEWMGLFARAPQGKVAALLANANLASEFEWLRKPEIGSVMLRGRAGAVGAPFNLGEMTVTRCSLRLPNGEVGHGYVQGRDKDAAQSAALADALLQTDAASDISQQILLPLRTAEFEKKKNRAEKAASTKVEFFTMARGED
ncbi:phosphonate C-P lyase system protein PhnG [Maritalea porphyrae]|jgi:alpha-D-ribose 1-methylphosphonate 5-triphosphate synthase subunit PhnG|uniref:phosphonate C-P lyase system protein PhnG n=1 Tax=Maritalea porphyrae TaxID=880732 RepID=UPI0022B00181|nr:phosphonate C-P lyase system protein PhnG [Maritalea porphyrae]MCZ4273390.1 phosphonate C-P lyase system protein PhnG [Maritalea porphyrae]